MKCSSAALEWQDLQADHFPPTPPPLMVPPSSVKKPNGGVVGFKNVAVLDVGRQVKGKLRKLCPEGFAFVERLKSSKN